MAKLNINESKALGIEGFFLSDAEALELAFALYEARSYKEALLAISNPSLLNQGVYQANYIAALCHKELGEWGAAEKCVMAALKLNQCSPEAWNLLGEMQLEVGADSRAILDSFEKALERKPGWFNPILNIGNFYWRQGDFDASLPFYRKALEADPLVFESCYNYARALHQKGVFHEAIDFYARAIHLNESYAEPFWNKSLCYLLSGDYARGWQFYDYRLKLSTGHPLHAMPNLPLWGGGARLGDPAEPVLIVSEQGFGDTIQFIRYLKDLSELGIVVRFAVQPQLHDLIIASGLHPSPMSPKEVAQCVDGNWLPLLSLPKLLGVTPENVIRNEPYLRPLRGHLSKWKKLLSKEKLPVIGIHWQGNHLVEAANESFRGRSIPLEMFAPLLERNSITFLSLQKGFGSEQIHHCSFSDSFVSCQAEVDRAWDFLETLAIIEACDLVITSDSAVAHLAGGLGKETWLLLMHVPEWRWGMGSDRTFWYPSVRLFRQASPGDWQGLLQSVSDDLTVYLAGLAARRQSTRRLTLVCGDSFRVGLRKRQSRLRAMFNPFWEWVESAAQKQELAAPETMEHVQVDVKAPAAQPLGAAAKADMAIIAKQLLADDLDDDSERVSVFAEALAGSCHPALLHCLGRIYLRRGCCDNAIRLFRSSLKQSAPRARSKALASLALCWQIKGWLPRAQGLYRVAMCDRELGADVMCNYACLLHELGELSQAVELLERAIGLDPAHAHARFNLACVLFALGDYERGWPEYEWRFRRPSVQTLLRDPGSVSWNGRSSLTGKTILIMGEQGYGDLLQFWRYALLLEQEQDVRCVACLPQALHGLIASSGFSGQLLSPDDLGSAAFDEWVPLCSLPGLLGVSASAPRIVGRYIHPSALALKPEGLPVAPASKPLVGICWQANPAAETFVLRGRSLPLEAFAPLAAMGNVSLLSLQKLQGAEQLAGCKFRSAFVDGQEAFTSWLDFSAVAVAMSRCDLIVTVDTYVAHLAGAMGHPTWLLLHHVPDWRWGLEGETTFWYPSMRLFRQREPGNWDEVMERVATALQEFVAAHSV